MHCRKLRGAGSSLLFFFARENREKHLQTLMINHAAKRAKVCKLHFRSQFFLGDALRKGSVPTEMLGT